MSIPDPMDQKSKVREELIATLIPCSDYENFRTCLSARDPSKPNLIRVCSHPSDLDIGKAVILYCHFCSSDINKPCAPTEVAGNYFNDCARECENPFFPGYLTEDLGYCLANDGICW